MTAFLNLPIPVQNTVCFLSLCVCAAALALILQLSRQKRLFPAGVSLLVFMAAYLILQTCREGSEERLYGRATETALRILALPAWLFPLCLCLLGLALLLIFADSVRWSRDHISSASIKESLDGLPAGVCCYLEEGRCVLVNHRMNDICRDLTGRALLNGAAFYETIRYKAVHTLSDGRAVSFRHRVFAEDGISMHELIADDITELYEQSETLRRDNERSRQLGAAMKTYGATVTDTVRRQEILQAKINIHDGMNRMILATRKAAAEPEGSAFREEILRMWQSQAQLLSREADIRQDSNVVLDLNALAGILGVQLVWDGTIDSEETETLSLFLTAAREALINAAKHAQARTLTIAIHSGERCLDAVFTNDGRPPQGAIEERGGLHNLRLRLEKAGGSMNISSRDVFSLHVGIPKGGEQHAI